MQAASKPSDLPFDLTIDLVDYDSALSPYKSVLPTFVFEHFEFLKANLFRTSNENYEKLLFTCDVLIDYSWEMLNTNLWVFVDDYWRLIYAFAIFYKIIYKSKQASNRAVSDASTKELIKLCDLGLLMSGPLLEKQFDHIVRYIRLQSKSNKPKASSKFNAVKVPAQQNVKKAPKLTTKYLLKIEKNPSIEHFNEIYFSANRPVIIEGQMSHWPAMKKWRFNFHGSVFFCFTILNLIF
jgi:hypothetical protein